MSNLFVSIVVPVYNVAPYLEKSLESVLRQGLGVSEYEVIMVDDGSTDNSSEICHRYAERYPNFRLVSQRNAGVSAARNRGIDEAWGEYVVFLDADDYFLDNGLQLASCQFRGRSDVDVIHYFSSYDFWPKNPINNEVEFDGMGHDYILHSGLPSFCWLFFYRKTFLDKHHLRFKPYIVGEDQLFSSAMCIANPHIVSTKADIYRYVVRDQSATTRRDVQHTRKCVDDYLDSYHDIMQAMHRYGIEGDTPVFHKCIESVNSKKMFGFSRILSAAYCRKDFSVVSHKCRSIGFYPVFSNSHDLRTRGKVWLMNIALTNYKVYKCVAFFFNYIVVRFVLPRLRKRL